MEDDWVNVRLTQVFREVFRNDAIVLNPEMTAKDIDGWDSLRHLRLVVTIERKFRIRLPSTKVASLKTVGELTELIRTYASE